MALSGGVASNRAVRDGLSAVAEAHGATLVFPPPSLCTDNAAMIASAGYYRLMRSGACELSANAMPGADLADVAEPSGVGGEKPWRGED